MRYVNPTARFSEREKQDLLRAWLLTSLAFAVFFIRTGLLRAGITTVFILALLTAGVGFILHELCHKLVASRFGVHGEFVANGTMLLASVLFAFFGFIFAAPGAVHITSHVTRKEHGMIAAAGPACNLALVGVFWPFTLLPGFPGLIGLFGVWTNALLGAFNLIPFLGLDGGKVLVWDTRVYAGMVLTAGLLIVLAYTLV